MAAVMRAKMRVVEIKKNTAGEEWNFACVTDKPFDPEGISDDNVFSKYSPSGELRIFCTNPALFGKFQPGEKYYLDFTKADN